MMLVYNTVRFNCLAFCLTPFLLIQNMFIVLDVVNYEREPTFKSTFVRFIGQHDSLFIMLCYTAVVCFNALVDGIV